MDLADFHRGTPAALDRCYREHFDDVGRAVGRVLQNADKEAVIHQVFYRLVSDARLRANFQGGNFAAWITVIARNEAIDFRRRHERERSFMADEEPKQAAPDDDERDARLLVERFVREHLSEKLHPLFEARFLRQLSQREAAKVLGMHRTTLVYQEEQIRLLLREFLLGKP
ncbi:MAG TPA: sigma-70 family RNA polymerase sigma factor [Labilithrix sp.]|nr:sigma-70 family RNA polymerase sigma factor [Labilithrix sp.]